MSSAIPTKTEGAAVRRPRPHLYQVDWIRAVTTLAVISVHSVFFTNPPNSIGAGAIISLLHYTREAFMFMTGLVLFYSYYPQLGSIFHFWAKRFYLIGLPYVLWSAIYVAVGNPIWKPLAYFKHLGSALLTGSAWYHLYYLLVTMQIYLLLPVMVWALRKAARWHGWILLASALLQLGITAVDQYALPTHGWLGQLFQYRGMEWFSYQFYILLGALAAIHLEELNRWVSAHRRLLLGGWLASVALAWAWYGWNLWVLHESVIDASAVLQPFMVPYCFFWILTLYRWGLWWGQAGSQHWLRPLINGISRQSFGIYLIHPFILWLQLQYLLPHLHLSHWLVTPGVIAVTAVASYLIIAAISHTQLNLLLLGQRGAAARKAGSPRPAPRVAVDSISVATSSAASLRTPPRR